MERDYFGSLPFRVSRLSIGTGTFIDTQRQVPVEDYDRVLRRALQLGINFWDTADDYGTYPAIKRALQGIDRTEVVLATKTWERTGQKARQSLEKSLSELGLQYVDVMLLHGVRTDEWPQSMDAILALQQAKREGLVRAVGLSTHHVPVARAVANTPEVEVVYTTVNKLGYMVEDGSLDEMIEATRQCHFAGKGVAIMKTLADGQALSDIEDAFRYSLEFPYAHSVLVGIMDEEELEVDVRIAEGQVVSEDTLARLRARHRGQGTSSIGAS